MKSVFDGWTKKIEHKAFDNEGGFCAMGWLSQPSRYLDSDAHTIGYYDDDAATRIGTWIIQNMNPPIKWEHRNGGPMQPALNPSAAVVWANNECKLDIEGFKMVDLLTRGYVPEENTTALVTVDSPVECVVA